jgi:hypothetical protein
VDFKRQLAVAGVSPLDRTVAHTGEYLKEGMEKLLIRLENPAVHILLRDAESVMNKTARLTGIKSIDCFLHLILTIYTLVNFRVQLSRFINSIGSTL